MSRQVIVAPAAMLMALQLACAVNPVSVPAPLPATDSISEAEIQQEMRSISGRKGPPILLGLFGGAVGLVIGAKIGYEIDYGRDIQRGCEDCGLSGLMVGAAIGLPTGIIGGAVLGSTLERDRRRAEAIRRIRARRAAGTDGGG